VFLAVCVAVVLFSCHQPDVVVDVGSVVYYPEFVHKLEVNSLGYGVTILEGLPQNNDIYLARVKNNRTQYNRHALPADSGEGQEESRSLAEVVTTETGETIFRYERHWQVTPPDEEPQVRNRTRYVAQQGESRYFFVDVSPVTKVFTLQASKRYCNVWIANEDFGTEGATLTVSRAEQIAEKFDLIYPIETQLLGYEYGGGLDSAGNLIGHGGMDGDPKIQILLFDIDGDGGNSNSNGITHGYFYPGDAFTRGGKYPYSNEGEIFYLDSYTASTASTQESIYSTLIHEFNHMINFHLKVLVGGDYVSWNTEVWYTEMLSMLAENIIGPLVPISNSVNTRIPEWIGNYANLSVMYWPSSGNTLPYYASNYAFGVYLMRNFGGEKLFSDIAKSNASGRGSIDHFMRIHNNNLGIDTAYAMSRFSEALLYSYSPSNPNILTFNNPTAAYTIGGKTYKFESISLGSGPKIFKYEEVSYSTAPINTVQLYSDKEGEGGNTVSNWENEIKETGRLTIKLLAVDPNADYYIITKPK
jgi:hypothetical protein